MLEYEKGIKKKKIQKRKTKNKLESYNTKQNKTKEKGGIKCPNVRK